MDVSKLRIHGVKAMVTLTLVALTVGAGTMRASNAFLASAVAAGTVSCSTLTGLGTSATITVKPVALTSPTTVTVSVYGTPLANGTGTLVTGGLIVTPLSYTLTSTTPTTGVVFNVTAAPGCAGLTSPGASGAVGSPVATTVQLETAKASPTVGIAYDLAPTVNATLQVNGSPLVVAAPITVSCGRNGTGPYTYTPSSTLATLSVASAAVGGTPFTISPTSPAVSLPTWISFSSPSGSPGPGAPATITASAVSPCDTLAPGGTYSTTVTLTSPQSLTVNVNVTINVVGATPLTATPASFSLSHVKGSGSQTQTVTVTSSNASTYYTVNTTTLPIWLTVNTTFGVAPASLTFSTTTVADTMPPGTYSATVYLQVYGLSDLPISVTLFATNTAPKLSISSANPLNISWVQGTAAPTATITAISSDSPIPYSITTAGTLTPTVSATETTGLAYSFGTNIAVTFPAQVYQTVQPGTVLTGSVSLTWGSPATISTVTINLTVAAPGAALSAISPATVPTAPVGTQVTITLSGSGFVGGSTATSTKVGIVVGGLMVADSNISLPTVVNPSEMYVTITAPPLTPTPDTLLPFSLSGAGGSVLLGVCNGTCIGSTVPSTAQFTLNIGNGPVIQGVTSSSTFTEVTPPALPSFAPYDMISIFGVNFCSSVGTGCSTNTILTGGPTGAALTYPFFLSPDALPAPPAVDTRRRLTVNFYTHLGESGTAYPAPLLFATNGQINAMVPGGLSAGSPYDIVVSFDCLLCTPATTLNSAPFEVNIVTSDPGIFTIGADGQGSAAALENSNYSLITSAYPAGARSTGTDSDILQLYMTGLGAPNSAGTNLSAGTSPPTVPTDCIGALTTAGVGSYEAALNTLTGTTAPNLDGAVIQGSLINTNDLPPCFTNATTVTIGGIAGTVKYAGFVPNSIAGLYQVDVLLPVSSSSFTNTSGVTAALTGTPVQVPVQVTINSVNSQSGVTMYIQRKLHVVAPTALLGQIGVAWSGSGNAVVASEGSGTYTYNITSGVLPVGLSMTAGAISGTPGAESGGSYTVTVTATDTSSPALSDSVTFTIVITSPLSITSTGTIDTTFGTAAPTATTVTASGGTSPYTYTLTSPTGEPTITVGATTGVLATTALTPAGTYPVVVHAADSSSLTEFANDSFNLVVALEMNNTTPVAQTHGTSGVVTTVTATGNTGTIVYTLDATSLTNGFTVTSSGQVEPTTVASSGPYTVTVTATDSVTMATGATAYGTGSTAPLSITLN